MADIEKLKKVSVDDLLHELRTREAKAGKGSPGVSPESSDNLRDFDDASIAEALKANQRVIYGTDDRVDVFQLPAGANRDDSDSVVALFKSSAITDNGNGTSRLQTEKFGVANNLCAGEPFRDQPVGAFCSGFLVTSDVIATAGYCVKASNVKDVRFVFGFRMRDATTPETIIKNAEIYRGVELLGRKEVGTGADWALVRIDRPVLNHRIVRMRHLGKIGDQQALHVIGHPAGLPTKFADQAAVRNNQPSAFFVANLDTYGGNSGSPVFNSATHEVEGILVRGDTDFVQQGSCNISLVCPTTGCRGEDCTRTTEFAKLVPVTSVWPNGKVYLFKGSQYMRYDLATDKVDAGWPKPIAGNWHGFPANFATGINAAVMWSNGKAYFFKGNEYVRFDVAADKVDPGYPKPIAGNWPGLWSGHVDAAIVWPNGKAYFFRGSQYLRYDLATDSVDKDWPKAIQGNWQGFPASFTAGINAAVMWTNGKAYFFKGAEYIRYDIAADKVDAGYPKPIAGNWTGLWPDNIDA
jgi:hypothetical protein